MGSEKVWLRNLNLRISVYRGCHYRDYVSRNGGKIFVHTYLLGVRV